MENEDLDVSDQFFLYCDMNDYTFTRKASVLIKEYDSTFPYKRPFEDVWCLTHSLYSLYDEYYTKPDFVVCSLILKLTFERVE